MVGAATIEDAKALDDRWGERYAASATTRTVIRKIQDSCRKAGTSAFCGHLLNFCWSSVVEVGSSAICLARIVAWCSWWVPITIRLRRHLSTFRLRQIPL